MRVLIERGRAPSNVPWLGNCPYCTSTVMANVKELEVKKVISDYGHAGVGRCPVCTLDNTVTDIVFYPQGSAGWAAILNSSTPDEVLLIRYAATNWEIANG